MSSHPNHRDARKIQYYKGIIKRVTPIQTYNLPNKRGSNDYCKIGIKTADGKRILINLNTTDMGWSGILHTSKIYYFQKKSNRYIKTSMSNPERYIGQEVKVKGELHAIDEKTQKYKLSPVLEFILYINTE